VTDSTATYITCLSNVHLTRTVENFTARATETISVCLQLFWHLFTVKKRKSEPADVDVLAGQQPEMTPITQFKLKQWFKYLL